MKSKPTNPKTKAITKNNIEDFELLLMMKQADWNQKVSKAEVMKKLNHN